MSYEIRQYGIEPLFVPYPGAHPVAVRKGRELEIAYLAHDHDAGNPLDDQDGMGHIYTCFRGAPAKELENFRQALGLDEDGDPSDQIRPNPNAVPLDCFRHGIEVWSISGEGTQCQWDTGRRVGVWVPDSCLLEEVDRRRRVYAFGKTVREQNGWSAKIEGKEKSPSFRTWGEAFGWLEQAIARHWLAFPTKEQAAQGRRKACSELAREALEQYNGWLRGDCYRLIQESFTWKHRWKRESHEVTSGLVGLEYALEELNEIKGFLTVRRAA
ncbi:MAG: hypothetical protein KJZ90_00295 [Rhodocyclaceae bacterium]|nr:hypothetical protein [Rhodocyclaceae bacterium]